METTSVLNTVNVFPSLSSYESNKSSLTDKEISLVAGIGVIVAALLEQNGYVKYSNGLILQWGTNQSSPITFPISFTKTVFTVLPILQTADGGNMSKNRLYVINLTVNGFTIYNPQNGYNWLAIGV